MDWNQLFEQFLREKRFLANAAEATITSYRETWNVYRAYSTDLTMNSLNGFVVSMRERGLKVGGCNSRIRVLNSFLSWLHQNHYTDERVRIKILKQEQRILKGFSDEAIRAFVKWKPKRFCQYRLHALICFLIDTGARVTEVLELEISGVDLENLLVTLKGKGGKTRIVPISLQFRKILFNYMKRRDGIPGKLLFPARTGLALNYENMLRDLTILSKRLGISGQDGSFHAFRRAFARNFIKRGGSPFILMKMLGHTSLEMTKKYVYADEQDLLDAHAKTSMLSRLI